MSEAECSTLPQVVSTRRKPWRFGSDDVPQIHDSQPSLYIAPVVQEEEPPLSSVEHSPSSTCEATVVDHPAATDQSALQPPGFGDLYSAPIATVFDHLPQDAQPPSSSTERQTTHMFFDQATHPPVRLLSRLDVDDLTFWKQKDVQWPTVAGDQLIGRYMEFILALVLCLKRIYRILGKPQSASAVSAHTFGVSIPFHNFVLDTCWNSFPKTFYTRATPPHPLPPPQHTSKPSLITPERTNPLRPLLTNIAFCQLFAVCLSGNYKDPKLLTLGALSGVRIQPLDSFLLQLGFIAVLKDGTATGTCFSAAESSSCFIILPWDCRLYTGPLSSRSGLTSHQFDWSSMHVVPTAHAQGSDFSRQGGFLSDIALCSSHEMNLNFHRILKITHRISPASLTKLPSVPLRKTYRFSDVVVGLSLVLQGVDPLRQAGDPRTNVAFSGLKNLEGKSKMRGSNSILVFVTPQQLESHVSFPRFPFLRRWALLAAPLHRMLNREKTTTRNSVNPKVSTTAFLRATAVNNANNNLTPRSRYLMTILFPGSGNYN
ncbi:uncharacterized protein LACBIDRAFT_334321 [Laccaria bicolor S238N-H82]|uniref:Predicted protein n=1 Tax=Laccaria bicolor (strain S238N-H82 / ATCC MYA-4686) TaxID=486041 RepID=B0DYU7_LACBS|nr:uncharacterized protein LACBIDRAFT_334321 [Laccaria bicolor S238N-H82]EDR00201.1 predicted protein [Laccaria bicolor S238N-H82]|eukprot:XP_001889110.1 predicted protein [Laccaria bicolor S238N-H82]